MSAETLRRAAALMRERAEVATPGPWRTLQVGQGRADVRGLPEHTSYDYRGDAVATAADSEFGASPVLDAEHIASWHPAVALAVADWLEHAAARAESKIEHGGKVEPVWSHERDALAVARAYLGEANDE